MTTSKPSGPTTSTKSRVSDIEALIAKYRITPQPSPSSPSNAQQPSHLNAHQPSNAHQSSPSNINAHQPSHTILITGTTGSLGSYTLSLLLSMPYPTISKIYALNRPNRKDVKQRQLEAFVDKGLDTRQLEDERLSLLVGDLDDGDGMWGLERGVYEMIQLHITLILHIAWPVNFTQPLRAFEANIRGSCNLIRFALGAPNYHAKRLRFIFASSISTVLRWGLNSDEKRGDERRGEDSDETRKRGENSDEKRGVPETVLDPKAAVSFGYAEAKYVVDRILNETPLNSTSLRIGQISGSTKNGAWPIEEWMPMLVKTSLALGMVPSHPGCLSWLPVDSVAHTIVDIAVSPSTHPYPPLFNICSPNPSSCDRLIRIVNNALVAEGVVSRPLKVVESGVWLERLAEVGGEVREGLRMKREGLGVDDVVCRTSKNRNDKITDDFIPPLTHTHTYYSLLLLLFPSARPQNPQNLPIHLPSELFLNAKHTTLDIRPPRVWVVGSVCVG
ncbi:hypothetical protein CVT24_009924 [Panaeolus cyanescens]|uniref:Thioester reductase (TE) domain-containing protein n=1 Tax=Panaeolus cyanescens TaxID=181874 RepID=A0A409WM29_9AGAR|nr:hypothetical protein CVT24_009924 [Panaeolus cyanescens]